MTIVEVMGWIGIAAGAAVIVMGAWALCGKLWWHISWNWGDARQMRRSVRLGWNAGPPPVGEWVLVREHADGLITGGRRVSREHEWALMRSNGERAVSASGGYSTPIRNITGWLHVIEGAPDAKDDA